MVCCALTEQVTAKSNAVIVRFIKTIVKYTLQIHLRCKAYLTKSGLRVFGFCPAGSTSKVDLTFGKRGVVLEYVS